MDLPRTSLQYIFTRVKVKGHDECDEFEDANPIPK